MFSNGYLILSLALLLAALLLAALIVYRELKADWRRGFSKGFAMGQSHELDSVLKLYSERYYGGSGGIDARSLYEFINQLRRLEHRS